MAGQAAGQQHAGEHREGAVGGEAFKTRERDQQQAGNFEPDPRPPDRREAAAQQQVGQWLTERLQKWHVGGRGSLGQRGEECPDHQQDAADHDKPMCAAVRCSRASAGPLARSGPMTSFHAAITPPKRLAAR